MTAAANPLAKHPAFDPAVGALVCPICGESHGTFKSYNRDFRGHDPSEHLATTQMAKPAPAEGAPAGEPQPAVGDSRTAQVTAGVTIATTVAVLADAFGLTRPASLIPVALFGAWWAVTAWLARGRAA